MNNFELMLEKLNADGSETFQLDKGLTDKEALKQFKEKGFKFKKDHRGYKYNKTTGKITYV